MRVLHCSDIHLDRPFAGLDRDAARERRAGLRSALERIVALVAERRADLLTIAGDLWEDEHVTADTRRYVSHLLGRAGIPVLLAPGNHDPHVVGGHYARTAWPANVRIFEREEPEEVRFANVAVWGVAWRGGRLDTGWLDGFHVPADGRTHVLLMHGSATRLRGDGAQQGDDRYAPFDPSAPARCGFALCLAGHYHDGWHDEGLVYPGSPEPLGWGETGLHSAAVIDIGPEGILVELVETASIRFAERSIDCEGAISSAEVSDRLAAGLTGVEAETTCLRVLLEGQVGVECLVDPSALAAPHRARFAALELRDLTGPAFAYDTLAARTDASGHFVRALRTLAASTDDPREREMLRIALDAGLHALEGRRQVARVD